MNIFIRLTSGLLALIQILFSWIFTNEGFRKKYMSEKTETKYYCDDTGERVANIPYDNYIYNIPTPKDSIIVNDLSEDNSAEKNGNAIQTVIDSLDDAGGTVVIPSGRYYTNTVRLKSNVTLFIPSGAELISIECDDNENSDNPLTAAVIYTENAENIAITGGGTINGSGLTYVEEPKVSTTFYALKEFNTYIRVNEARKHIREGKDTSRNSIINFTNCQNVLIDDIVLKDTASWTCRFNNCSDVKVNNMVIDNNMHIANSDGIDICGGNNYSVNHCFIVTGDDGIVLKPSEYAIEKVSVSDCEISSCANCFKIGTETQFDVSDINVDNCYFFMPDNMTYGYSGIAVESCDGSDISNVNISNITMDGISSPLLIWLGNRMEYNKTEVGSIDGVVLENINATNIEMPCAIVGCIGDDQTYYVKNVIINNFTAAYRDTDEALHIRKKVNEVSMNGYPEITRVSHHYFISHALSRYSDLPCYSVCVKHAENVQYENIKITPRTVNTREEYYIDDVK